MLDEGLGKTKIRNLMELVLWIASLQRQHVQRP